MTYHVQWSKKLCGSFQTELTDVPYRRKTTLSPWVVKFFTAKFWHDFPESRMFTRNYHCSRPSRPTSTVQLFHTTHCVTSSQCNLHVSLISVMLNIIRRQFSRKTMRSSYFSVCDSQHCQLYRSATSYIAQDAARQCDDFQIFVLMNRLEYEKHKKLRSINSKM
jgi:hypothetical protein